MNLDVNTSENYKLKTIWFSNYRKLEKARCCASCRKKNEIKKQNTYNMAVKCFFGKNKEIFRHRLFVGIKFPYLFLLFSLCSRSQTFVQHDTSAKKTLWFLMPKPYSFFRLLLAVSFWYHDTKNPCKKCNEDGP